MKLITANRLADGEVVWLGANGGWVDQCRLAAPLNDDDTEGYLTRAPAAAVVGPYLIDAVIEDGCPTPVRLRERIRANGPSVLAGLGKQARYAIPPRAA